MPHKLLKVLKFHLFPSLGTATHLSVLQFYYFDSLVIKAVAIVEIFIVGILHIVSMYSHIQIVHMVWLIGIKTNGNYRNFIIFTCFIHSIMCMYIQIQKPILFHHWFGSLAVKAGEIIEISIISHLFPAV